MVLVSNFGKIQVLLSFSLVYISLVGLITITNGQIEWRQLTNLNRIRYGALSESKTVKNLNFQKVSYLGFVFFSAMFESAYRQRKGSDERFTRN